MNPNKAQAVHNARRLIRQYNHGVLSTHSVTNQGFPFGSVSTFIATHEGDIVFYISDLAQHTKNIHADPKMSFTLYSASQTGQRDSSDDPNANARLTLLGEAQVLPADSAEHSMTSERFFGLHPNSRKYQEAHDFDFYKMKVSRARFIGGFGDIHWFSEKNWRLDTPEWKDAENGMIKHMNEDHEDAMLLICAHYANREGRKASMLAINPDGAHYQIDGRDIIFVPFENTCLSSTSVREELVRQTHTARANQVESSAA